MKVQIIYIDTERSKKQAQTSLKSFKMYGWDAELYEGITPSTLDENDFPYKDLKDGRLEAFKYNEPHKYPIKKSCLFNNLKFAERVIEAGEPMVFAEHDSLCISKPEEYFFTDYLFLSFEYAFSPPTALAKEPFLSYKTPFGIGISDFPDDYPLRYYRDTLYNNHIMSPGTACYALSPTGARKILAAAERNGLEQSDFIYNSYNVSMQYVNPSPVRYQKENLNTSHVII